jgi:hypothetical protein
LSGGCDLRGATSARTTEGVARGGGSTTSGELSLTPALGARAGRSIIRAWPESASFPAWRARGGRRSQGISSQEPSWAQPRRRTPSRPDGGPRASTTTATTARATTTTVDVGDATTSMTTATSAGRQTREVHRPLVRASVTRSFLRVSVLRPTFQGTTGTPIPACGSRTTGSHATPGERWAIKNPPLYLGDFARTWLEHLPRDKINDWTDLRRVFVDNFQGTYMRPSK